MILKATAEGLPLWLAPMVLVVMNIVYAAGAFPAGILSDRVDARSLLLGGIGCLIVADLVLAYTSGIAAAFCGICLWGLHMALTQGLLAKLVADKSSPRLRGSAFGLFNLATGLALLAASVAAGILWDLRGSDATFMAGALFAAAAGLTLVLYRGLGAAAAAGA